MNRVSLSDQLIAMPIYAQQYRAWRRWQRNTVLDRVLSSTSDRKAANVLIKAHPEWSRFDHRLLAELHDHAGKLQQEAYHRALDEAAIATFGRPFRFGDYRICCIGREEFSDDWKAVLRYHGYTGPKHRLLAAAHRAACRSRRLC